MIHKIGFKHAWEGMKYAFTTQPNFKVHSLVALAAIFVGLLLRLSRIEWLTLMFTICLVFVAEMINTAIESMTDLIEKKHHLKAKIAKDVSAGMVLVAAISSIIVALLLFVPKIFAD